MSAQQDAKRATERRTLLSRSQTLAPLKEFSASHFITSKASTWDRVPQLTTDKRHARKMMNSMSVNHHHNNHHHHQLMRPLPNANVLQKLRISKKGQQKALLLASEGRIRLPLSEALAISPHDETLHAIKRAHAAAAANVQGRSRQRLAHKFSSAALDGLVASDTEPSVTGIWSGGEPQWLGEYSTPQRSASRRSTSLPPAARDTQAPARPRQPRLHIPSNPRGTSSPSPELLQHHPGQEGHSDFAEFGYVSPVSSPSGSAVFPRSALVHDDDDDEPLSSTREHDSAGGSRSTSSRQTFFFNEDEDEDDADDDDESEADSLSDGSSQDIKTPPQSVALDIGRNSVAWSIKDPSAAGVFDDDENNDEYETSLRPAGLTLRKTKSATLIEMHSLPEHAISATRPEPRVSVEERFERLRAAGVQQHKLDALGGLDGSIPAQSANLVVLGIMRSCHSMKDLFSLALANRGFYTAFKSDELALMKRALRNQSPAAWEYREMALESLPFDQYTPEQYLAFHTRDVYVLAALKEMLCGSRHLARDKMREATLHALQSRLSRRAVHIDDAFWRIWTFCELFGPERGEEEDITAQMDWLRGGTSAQTARQAMLSDAVVTPKAASRSSTGSACQRHSRPTSTVQQQQQQLQQQLRIPPPNFGKGNPGGLSNEQLEDLQEIWIGLKNLLSRVTFGAERVSQAAQHGVFDDKPPHMDDDECLEEWICYLLGLGPSVVQDVAAKEPCEDGSVFATAKHMGWTDWTVLASGASRRTFLDEAVKRVSLDQCAEAQRLSPVERANTEALRDSRRSRGKSLANELRETKKSTNFREIPFSEERPMSLWLQFQSQEGAQLPELVQSPMSGYDSGDAVSPAAARVPAQTTAHRKQTSTTLSLFPREYSSPTSPQDSPQRTATASRRASAVPARLTTRTGPRPAIDIEALRSTVDAPHELHPALRNNSTGGSGDSRTGSPSPSHSQPTSTAGRSNLGQYNGHATSPVQENSVDRFVWRIVEMGFTADEARRALGRTDDGKCLSVDRAVEWLLSGAA